jgi:hypothetical protein
MTTLKIPIKHKTKGINYMEIDEEDFDKIKHLNLTLNDKSNKNTYYARASIYENGNYKKRLNIHRVIMGLGDYKNDKRIIHHIDGNGLNNKKDNLVICNQIYNSQGFNYVHKNIKNCYFENDPKRKCKWRAVIRLFGKKHSKRFLTEEECKIYIKNMIDNNNDPKL